jgi:hypothetical protein
MSRFLKRVNRTPVAVELLIEALEMHDAMPPKDRSVFEARAFGLFQMLKRKGLSGDNIGKLAMAIDFRLAALARVICDGDARGWVLPSTTPGADSVHSDLLQAAAEEPLIEGPDGRASFNVQNFQRRVLRIAESQGNA